MRKYLIAILLIFGSISIFANCPVNATLANALIPCVSGFDPNSANISARVWIQGLNDPTEGLGTDSDGVPAVEPAPCGFQGDYVLGPNDCSGFGVGTYYFLSDWLNLPWDGCPGITGSERAVLLVYDTSGHYTLQSRLRSEDWTNWDAIGTHSDNIYATSLGTIAPSANPTDVDVTFNPPAWVAYSYYNGAAPTSPIVTAVNVYFREDVNTPASSKVTDWTFNSTVPITAIPQTFTVTVPALTDPVNNNMYMALSPVYEGTTIPDVLQAVMVIKGTANPNAGNVIASASATKSGIDTKVTWTSNDESMVTGYQIFWAPKGSTEFSAIGSRVAPQGNNHTYTQTVRIPATGEFVVKVGAYLTNGNVEYSSPINVGSSVIIKNKTRVVPN